jgi:hypothetical protein
LKKPDRGNTGRTRINTGASILERDATQGKDWDILPASFPQPVEAGSAGPWVVLFFEDWGEDGEVGPFVGGTRYVN